MPRRTNDFQRLIYLIHHQVAAGATVTESKFLFDRLSGKPVEVDIVIEGKVGEIPFAFGIECTAESRPATVEWVREMIGKHSDLPLNKTVLVAKSGFTKEATDKALAHGVDAITLKEAEDTNWTAFIQKLDGFNFRRVNLRWISSEVRCHRPPKIGDPQTAFGPHSMVREAGGTKSWALRDYINAILRDEDVFRSVMEQLSEKSESRFDFIVKWNCVEDASIQDDQGNIWGMNSLEISAVAMVDSFPLEFETGQFMGAQVAYGAASIVGNNESSSGKILVMVVGKENKPDTGAVMVDGVEGIFSFKFETEEEKSGE
jgi:hypothetical protein